MNDKTKHRLIIVAIIAAVILLWFWLRRNPQSPIAQAIQQAANDLGLPDLGLIPYIPPGGIDYGDDPLGSYVPAQMPGIEMTGRGYTPCNFCLQSTVQVTTPAPVQQIPAAPTPAQIRSYPPPRQLSFSSGSQPSQARPPMRMQWGGTF